MKTRKDNRTPLLLGRRLPPTHRQPVGFVVPQVPKSQDENELVTYDGTGHLLTLGPTGSGKTSQAICNALYYEGSIIVFDSTGGIYETTARRRREMGQEVHVVDLRDSEGSAEGSLNPLDLAARGASETAVIARSFAAHVVARTGQERDAFWNDWSETMVAAGINYAFALPPDQQNMSSVFDLYNHDDTIYNLAVVLDDKKLQLNRATRSAFSGFLQLSEQGTRSSVLGSAQSVLRLWDSDLIRRTTTTTSFDIDALINEPDEHPMSVFIIVPSYREAFRPLLRLWFSGLLTAIMQRRRVPRLKTLLLSDETASFGKVEAFLTAATQARAFGCQLWTHWQNASQLEANYGKEGAHTLVDNAGVLQFLGAPNLRAAKEFADLVGGTTADEIMALGPNEQLLLMNGQLERLRRLRYFEEEQFKGQYDAFLNPEPPHRRKPQPPDISH